MRAPFSPQSHWVGPTEPLSESVRAGKHCVQKQLGGSIICSSKTERIDVHQNEIKSQDSYTVKYPVAAKKTAMALTAPTWKDRRTQSQFRGT